jgi:hypothetical protein
MQRTGGKQGSWCTPTWMSSDTQHVDGHALTVARQGAFRECTMSFSDSDLALFVQMCSQCKAFDAGYGVQVHVQL